MAHSRTAFKKTDRHNITEILLKIADINLSLMQILASDIIQGYVLKQMLIRTVNADNLMSITVSIPLYNICTHYVSGDRN
jgi:hypothetical protein